MRTLMIHRKHLIICIRRQNSQSFSRQTCSWKGSLICNTLEEAEAGVKEIMEDKNSEVPEILWSLKNL